MKSAETVCKSLHNYLKFKHKIKQYNPTLPKNNNIEEISLTYYIIKLIITTFLIVLISEISKRSSLAGALLAAIPLVSILAMTWMYVDTDSSTSAVEFSNRIVWLIAPSMTLFIIFPLLIKKGVSFYPSMGVAIIATVTAYYMMILILGKFGIKL